MEEDKKFETEEERKSRIAWSKQQRESQELLSKYAYHKIDTSRDR